MERHGFGRNPNLPQQQPPSQQRKALSVTDWLDERITEVRSLQAELAGQLAQPVWDSKRVDLIQGTFGDVNRDVLRKLQSEAREWVDYYRQNPEWFDPVITRIRREDLQEVVRLMGFTIDQLVCIRDSLRGVRGAPSAA